jgi:Protein of unknown function (DUF669)
MRTTEEVLRQQEDDANYQRAHAGQTGATRMSDNTTLETPFDTDTEEGSRTLIPAGKYKAQITDAIVAPLKTGRGTGVKLTWSISEGDHEKRLLFQQLNIQHDSETAQRIGRGQFKDICSSCGITGQVTDLGVLLFKECLLTVVITTDPNGKYQDKNEVKNVLPIVSWNGAPPEKADGSAYVLKEASKTPKAFDATKENLDDKIPF